VALDAAVILPTSKGPYLALGVVVLALGVAIAAGVVQRWNAQGAAVSALAEIKAERSAREGSEQREAALVLRVAVLDAQVVDTAGHGQEIADAEQDAEAAKATAVALIAEIEGHLAEDTLGLRLSREREAEHVVEVAAADRRADIFENEAAALWLWRDSTTVLLARRAEIIDSQAREIVQWEFRSAAQARQLHPPWTLKIWDAKEEYALGVVVGWLAFGR